MSLPIPPILGAVTTAVAAARVAATAVQQVASVMADQASGAMTFGEVLQDLEPQSPAPRAQFDDLKSQFVESARKTLASLGIGPDEAVSLGIDQAGRIEIAGDNSTSVRDRAAQIEAVFAADSNLSGLAQQLLSISGTQQTNIELPSSGNLTIPLSQANMGTRFGG